jgi:hypothetical protein
MCMCAFPGTNAAKFLARVSEVLEKALGSPVPGTSILSLSGHPLGSSLEIAKAPGPADVSRLGLRISAGADILDKNLADRFCQNVQTDALAANDVVEPVMTGQDVCLTSSRLWCIQTQNPGSDRIRHRPRSRHRSRADRPSLVECGDETGYYQKGPKMLKGLKATIPSVSRPAGLLEKPGRIQVDSEI